VSEDLIQELINFVRLQLGDDERVARAAADEDPPPWHLDEHDGRIKSGPYTVVHIEDSTPEPPVAEHIARHDPARVLREVEAKRKVIELYEYAVAAWLLDRDKPNPPTVHLGEKAMAEAVLQALALPYSDRPGYREEWRP
jgi:hypothetical protein